MNCHDCNTYACFECGHCECPEWISVKDQEPDASLKRILVVSGSKRIQVLHRDYDDWCLTEYEDENGYESPGYVLDFTHWMALPQLPKDR